jgi:hypothetical protein
MSAYGEAPTPLSGDGTPIGLGINPIPAEWMSIFLRIGKNIFAIFFIIG